MGLQDLYNTVAAYTLRAPTDYTINGVDLLLGAINNAFKFADQFHDWHAQECVASITVDWQNGGDLTSATLVTDGETTMNPVSIKTIDNAYYSSIFPYVFQVPALIPVEINTKKCTANWIKERIRKRPRFNWVYRYPSDAVTMVARRTVMAYLQGNTFYFDPPFGPPQFPTGSMLATLDVQAKFPKWLAADVVADTDHWMFQEANEFLMYKALVELNMLNNMFVVRAEGFNPPPDKQWQTALNNLVLWDDMQYENAMGSNHQH